MNLLDLLGRRGLLYLAVAGGLSLPTPLGPIVSTNITPSKTHGIGGWRVDELGNYMRLGHAAGKSRPAWRCRPTATG